MKYKHFGGGLVFFFFPSIESRAFVTAVDHSNVIFACVLFEEREPGSDFSKKESCYLRTMLLEAADQTGNVEDGATQPFVFQHLRHHELGDLSSIFVAIQKCKQCLLGRERTS